jgi:WD40 repeat protein
MRLLLLYLIFLLAIIKVRATDGIELSVQGGHTSKIDRICFSPSNTLLASVDQSGKIILWEISTGSQLKSYQTNPGVSDMMFIDDSTIIYKYNAKNSNLIATTNPQKRKNYTQLSIYNSSKSSIIDTTSHTFYGLHIPSSTISRFSYTTGVAAMLPNEYSVIDFMLKRGGNIIYTHQFHDETFRGFFYEKNQQLIYLACSDGRFYIVTPNGKRKHKSLKGHTREVTSVTVSNDANYIATSGDDMKLVIWSNKNYKPIKQLLPKINSITALSHSGAKDDFYFSDINGFLKKIDFTNYKLPIKIVTKQPYFIDRIATSAKWGIVTSDIANQIVFYKNDIPYYRTYQLPKKYKTKDSNLYSAKSDRQLIFSLDDKLLLADGAYNRGLITLTNPERKFSYSPISSMYRNTLDKSSSSAFLSDSSFVSAHGNLFLNWEFSKKGTFFQTNEFDLKRIYRLINYSNDTCLALALNSVHYITKKSTLHHSLLSGEVKADNYSQIQLFNKQKVAISYSGKLQFLTANKQDVVTSADGHDGEILALAFFNSGDKVLTGANDGTMKVWNTETGELIVTVIPIDDEEKILVTPDNYYIAPRALTNEIGFKIGMKYYPAEQFDIKYNRPDIVLQRLGIANEALVTLLEKAYQKRLLRLGLTDSILQVKASVPTIEISNKTKIPLQTKENTLTLNLVFSDSKSRVNRLNVWVNNVPAFGKSGIRIDKTGQRNLEVVVKLNKGKNLIQVSCLNEIGAESLKQAVEVSYEPNQSTKPDLYLIAVSVAEYRNDKMNLTYSVKDGRDIVAAFLGQHKKYNKIYVDTLFNTSAVNAKIGSVKSKLAQAKVDDKVVIFFSGHGLLDKEGNFYYATWDCNFADPNQNGFPFAKIDELLDSIPARDKLLLMDACHSGELDKSGSNSSVNFSTKLINVSPKGLNPVGVKNEQNSQSLDNSFDLMQDMFTDLNKGSGASIISAAAGNSYALEGDKWKNGVFTYAVIEGMQNKKADMNHDKKISVGELKKYVANRVFELTNGAQKPTSRQENLYNNFNVWQ